MTKTSQPVASSAAARPRSKTTRFSMKPLKPEIPQAAALLMVTALATLPGVKMRTLTREVGALPLPLEAAALCERARVGASLEAAAEAAALRAEVDAAMPNPLRDLRAARTVATRRRGVDEKLRAEAAACGGGAARRRARVARRAGGRSCGASSTPRSSRSSARTSPRSAATRLAPSTPSSPTPCHQAQLPPRRRAAALLTAAFERRARAALPAATAALPASLALPAAEARKLAAELSAAAELHEAEAEALPPLPGDDQPPPWWKQILQQLIVAAIQMGLHVAGQQYKVWKAARAAALYSTATEAEGEAGP